MNAILFGPITRISLSLALLTLSILLTGDLFFGQRGEQDSAKMEARSRISEALAVQFSSLIATNDFSTIELSLDNMVKRDKDILSAALITRDDRIIAASGNHRVYWEEVADDTSSLTQMQVPIFRNAQRWGTVQIRFEELEEKGLFKTIFSPFVLLSIYVFLAGFIGYIIFMRRTLKHLDPGAVIPGRVRAALDVLSEGVVLMDTQQQVILANNAVGEKLGITERELLGKRLSQLGWYVESTGEQAPEGYPWQLAMQDGERREGTRMCLDLGDGPRTYMVNSSPIVGEDGATQGALATFDDVTELEAKNLQLSDLVGQLQSSRDEVAKKNRELKVLAERDPLTNCLNRRAFMERSDSEFNVCFNAGNQISVIMLDIDHFKSINDTYGHGVGDEVIKSVAATLHKNLRDVEPVGRYGGEEFCVLLPNTDIEIATQVAERLRVAVAEGIASSVPEVEKRVTASLGVSSLASGSRNMSDLIEQADQALYASKEYGRNQVTRWDLI